MQTGLERALHLARRNRSRYVDELGEWLAIPSVSTDPERVNDMLAAAGWLVDRLHVVGMRNVRTFPPDSRPIVYGEHLEAGPGAPTVLIYGHYDVQPAEPLEKWETDPFRAVVRGDHIFARGATDMKGQVVASLAAVEAILKTGDLPVNVKFLVEGEEEIGSTSLPAFLRSHQELLKADVCLNPDTGMLSPDLPTITYALRGLAYFELNVYGPAQDLHSGSLGGILHNPAQALTELIAGLHDRDGKVTLPGFYDDVRELDTTEREELKRLPITEDMLAGMTGAPAFYGEPGYTLIERLGARPTLEINGLYSGFIGEGAKTVLPAYAMAKISTRLVPNQDPDAIAGLLGKYLEENAPKTIRWELKKLAGGSPSISNIHSPWVQAMVRAQESVWGTRPLFKREGGSVPVVAALQSIMGIESVNVGVAQPADNMHGPNERLHLPSLHRGIEAAIHFLFNLAE